VLLAPALAGSAVNLTGELLGLTTSVLWTNYGRQSRKLSATLNGAEVSAHTMWRAGVVVVAVGRLRKSCAGRAGHAGMLGVQAYCIVAGGVVAFALWNRALGQWPASRVLLFNNLIPVSTMTWAHFCLGEPVTPTFLLALVLIALGVLLGQVAASRVARTQPSRNFSYGENSMDVKNLNEVAAFITKDGSEIRELLAHRNSAIRNQSLAEARLPVGASTQEHYHPKAEEIYYITHGTGRMRIEGEVRDVKPGDAIAIPPGLKHKLWNTGGEVLRLLCCCAPAYEHNDTVITET
jgi:mannose-6-phosphate isomerase-like protein (cupin superfamily)/uncharacterized membrane protein